MSKVERRFLKAVRASGLVEPAELQRVLDLQAYAAQHGRELPLDRILLKLELLSRDQILGLWRALRYYVWRKEDKFYVKVAVQSQLLDLATGERCLREQKKAYKHENQLVRVNEIARRWGYLGVGEDRAIVRAMRQQQPNLTVQPVPDEAVTGEGFEARSEGAATREDGEGWKAEARQRDLRSLKEGLAPTTSSSDLGHGVSDEDLDALWEEADLDDIELDSQAVEIAQAPLLDESDEDDDLF